MNWKLYYLFLGIVLIAGILYQMPHPKPEGEHYISANFTRINDTCRIVWLGGWDYESFVGDVRVNGNVIVHPMVRDIIYDGKCTTVKVEMYEKSVHSWVRLYNYSAWI